MQFKNFWDKLTTLKVFKNVLYLDCPKARIYISETIKCYVTRSNNKKCSSYLYFFLFTHMGNEENSFCYAPITFIPDFQEKFQLSTQ